MGVAEIISCASLALSAWMMRALVDDRTRVARLNASYLEGQRHSYEEDARALKNKPDAQERAVMQSKRASAECEFHLEWARKPWLSRLFSNPPSMGVSMQYIYD